MKQVLIKQGSVVLENVPAPTVEPGTVLVQVQSSCISIGTEMSGVRATGLPLWRRALRQPENVKKALAMIASQGLSKASSQINERLTAAMPTGYSAAGVVVEVGPGVDDFKVGDRVACAGAQCAFHAEYICVPKNLAVIIDDAVNIDHASTVTLGAIALQGVRRASPTLGETFVVIGLGILGQLTVQLLKANGCRVIGVDLDNERVRLAEQHGMDVGISTETENDIEHVHRLTGGIGADGVIITAATPSDAVISTAFKMCRKKGRAVLVGDVGLNLNRGDFYLKELDFFISSSYGPGRYDANYEEHGLDYPIGYVRWTENRNMAEYLRLIAEGRVRLDALISTTFPVDQATAAYETLKDTETKPLMVLLSYPSPANDGPIVRTIPNKIASAKGSSSQVRMAVIGAGNFAKGMHLPNIKDMPDRYQLHTVVSRTGPNAVATAKQFGAANASTDFSAILQDTDIDAVLIATRHNLHAEMVLQALAAGKHVLVEKPLAITQEELNRINEFYANAIGPQPILLTGFNRRFSPYAKRIKEIVAKRTNPMVLNYRMNAGYIPLDHWVHTHEGGGRNIGEACHIYDLFTFLTGSKVTSVSAVSIKPATTYYSGTDNFVANMSFADGSIATLTYTALGAKDYPKEQLEVFVDGMTIAMNDFKSLEITGSKAAGLKTKLSEKGQKTELEIFADVVKNGGEWPIQLWEQNQVSEMAMKVQGFLSGND
jgi:predicted dehydrogenase/threonine dehydrogenase-like Zn-dependent dehydrogenase